ncbi:PEGA domain-containing protein [Sorangium sp. So ce1036]|uniref:PEGA domain-containing protein n=1 Tax=Sorangium sp. So ce1036 TaxID=3133328 RepID=UPI003F0B5CC6
MNKHALMCSLGVSIALLAPASRAQTSAETPGAAEAEALTDKARQLYDEGLAALNQSRWVEAHASFLAAWRIERHYQIASNLGVAELRLGKYRDAAEHLSWYLREAPATRVTQRQRAEVLLKEALAKVAAITVKTEPEGAEVTVDGAEMGRTPLALPVFLEPGQHMIQAELDGYKPAQERIEPKAGDVVGMKLYLVRRDAEEPAAVEAPGTTGPRAASEPGPAGTTGPRAASEPGPAKLPETTVVPPAERSWVPMIALGAASVVGLGVGVGMTMASNNANDEARAQSRSIQGAGGQCIEPSTAFTVRCAELNRLGAKADGLGDAAFGSYVASGVSALAALTYALWPRRAATNSTEVSVLPNVDLHGSGIIVVGAW